VDVVVVGAGQAGLAVSRELRLAGVEHVVLEADAVASTWRNRWDSFSLVTPNWTLDLPGAPYTGDDPDGHVVRDDIVTYLEKYAADQAGVIRTGVRVEHLGAGRTKRLRLDTNDGPIETDHVVLCTGAYQRPYLPEVAQGFPDRIRVLHAADYHHPDGLPRGRVLVVGSGQTGVQLAEELHLAGRAPVLACGRAPWAPRRFGGRDIVTWLAGTPFFDQPVGSLPDRRELLVSQIQATGALGGHDLHYRVLQDLGVTLTGRLSGVSDETATFAHDLAASVAFGDARYAAVRRLLRESWGDEVPELPDPPPFVADPPTDLDLTGFGSVVFTTGYRPSHAGWVDFPVFDELGFPVVADDLSTAVPGLFFCGVHFLRTRRSSLLFGVGQDAQLVAATIAAALS